MAHRHVTDEELAELIRRTAQAASALIRGDVRTYLTLIPHAENYTLMDPFGGEPTRGFDASSEPGSLGALLSGWRGGAGTGGVIHVGRTCRVSGDRTAAWPGRWSGRAGLVAAGDLGLSP